MKRPAATARPATAPEASFPVGADRKPPLNLAMVGPATLPIASITRDPAINCRAGGVDEELATEYAEALTAGATLPPVVVFHADGVHLLADGWHRVRAHELAGRAEVPVDVREGDRRAALLHAVGCNASHGARRTNADKRRAVEALLADPEWRTWSADLVAERCAVSQPFVSSLRRATQNGSELTPTRGRDGKVRKAPKRVPGRRRPGTTPEAAGKGARRALDHLVKFWPKGVPLAVLVEAARPWLRELRAKVEPAKADTKTPVHSGGM